MPAGAVPAMGGAPAALARLLPLSPGLFAVTLEGGTGAAASGGSGLTLPVVQLCAPPDEAGAIEIVDGGGRKRAWLGARDMLFLRAPDPGGRVLVTAYFHDGAGRLLPSLRIRPIAPPGPEATVILATGEPPPVSIEIAAHIHGRGEVRVVDAEWVGQGDSDAAARTEEVIESFALSLRNPSSAAIEYKGLTASGAETPWVAGGTACGDPGGGVPLLGFAIRQKTGSDAGMHFDCEYSGRFRSGRIAGPMRNGAPCLSAAADDPLIAFQLRLRSRPVG